MMKKYAIGSFCILLTLLINACDKCSAEKSTESQSVKELKWYIQAAPDHPWAIAAKDTVEKINQQLLGKINLDLFLADSLGKQNAAMTMLRTASLFMYNSGPTLLIDYDNKLTVFSLPYIVQNRDHMYRIWDKIGAEFMVPSLEKSGIRTLTFIDFGTRTLTTKGVDVMTPQDLNGVKIRAIDYPEAIDMIRSLGATPVPVPFSELYIALQTGVTVGQENPIPTIYTNKYYEVQDRLILTNHMINVSAVFVADKVWQAFTPDEQNVFSSAITEYRAKVNKLMDESTESYLEKMQAQGMKLIKPDRAAFVKYSNEYILNKYGDKYGDVIQLINAQ